jgi:hypothetical protein
MKKLGTALIGALASAVCESGTAWADHTSGPSPASVVHAAGGGTALTGSNATSATAIGVLMVALGAAALATARWLANR